MKMRLLAVCAVSCLCAAVAAEEFTLKSSLSGMDFDWSQDSSYEGGAAPSAAGAYVRIPDGMIAKLSAADTASWAFVTNKVARIRPMGKTSRLVVDVKTANSPALLSSEVTYTASNETGSHDVGCLEKTGDGELQLGATGKYSYFTTITVREGTVSLYENGTEDKYYFDTFNVAANATLNLIGTTVDAKSATVCRKFFGEGTINNRNGPLQTFSSNTLASEFSGRFTGTSSRLLTVCSPITLNGTNSTASGVTSLSTSVPLYVKSFGRYGTDATTSSSLGVNGTINLESGTAGVVYLGEGETTDIEISLRSSSGVNYIDAGATGGLEMKSKVAMGTAAAAKHHAIALQGSNTTESVFSCRLMERYDANSPANYCPYHIVKRGTGTWRMKYVSNTMLSGGISVEEGTLKYDTIAEPGTLCALGYATNLYAARTGTLTNEVSPVNWAISLGTADGKEGTIEYSGTSPVTSTKRLVALKGDGRIRQNVEKPFRLRGISSEGENAKTLTLDGTGTAGNEISGISDAGGGAITVAKDGDGTWTLAATNLFRGALMVNGGTLNVCAPNWNWFKFIDRQGYTNSSFASPGKGFYLKEMAFFNSIGVSQTIGITFTNDLQHIQPGCFALGKTIAHSIGSTTTYGECPWDSLFDDAEKPCKISFSSITPTATSSSSWAPIVVRLPEDADPVHSFDYVWILASSKSGCNTQPAYFTVQGSMDGLEWHDLFETNNTPETVALGKWMANGASYSGGYLTAARTTPARRHTGVILPAPSSVPGPLDSASAVFVATNCTLKSLYGVNTLRSFGIDMATGGGTVDGFAFAERGTLTVVGAPREGATASFTPVNCTGVANLSNWPLVVNGRETSKFTVSVTDEGIVRLIPVGFKLIIR